MTAAAFTGLAIGAALLGLAYFSSGQPAGVQQAEYATEENVGAAQSGSDYYFQGNYNCIVDGTFTAGATATLETYLDPTATGRLTTYPVSDMLDIAAPQTEFVGPLALGAGHYRLTVTGGDGSTAIRWHCRRVLK
jgi:hypothetical protein